ncbi:hypothetical protein EPUS_00450 [Endocarpon pusillum Z07020]|uniref:DUF202 domain-containing protein n=1 Tax=Endocarpon pusillum (strain Z07020 / HMAS-L-300199) TaxID=1263415 RepID=U1FZA3_ENDPU|nr:uncharacterized protein EPUS_00450 [Endocarpon pusillum Z07020]ERF70262.1 hypothetical protein EPUS_00450 [Endocarpon pusillum Z07020]
MPNLRSKTRAQEAYDLIVQRKEHQEAIDKGEKMFREAWIRGLEEDLRHGKGNRRTRIELETAKEWLARHIRMSDARTRRFEEQLNPRRANLQHRYDGEAALLYCARTPQGQPAYLPNELCVKIAGINNRPATWDKPLEMPLGMGFRVPDQSPEDNQALSTLLPVILTAGGEVYSSHKSCPYHLLPYTLCKEDIYREHSEAPEDSCEGDNILDLCIWVGQNCIRILRFSDGTPGRKLYMHVFGVTSSEMEQGTGAESGDVIRIPISSVPHIHSRSPYGEGTELDAYPTRTDSGSAAEPIRGSGIRKAWLRDLWSKEAAVLVEPKAFRDHLANERTFLAWLRTSLALSMIGIFTTQLFILQAGHLPHMNLSFFVLGVPLGSLCQAAALINIIIGAYRFWRLQRGMVKGQACAGGWELFLIGGLVTLIILAFFILVLMSDSDQHTP